jgi:hypothetical protein
MIQGQRMGKIVQLALTTICVAGLTPSSERTASPPVRYPDGAVATAQAACSASDLCGSVALSDGGKLQIYNVSGGRCIPYTLRLLRTVGETIVSDSSVFIAHGGSVVTANGHVDSYGNFSGAGVVGSCHKFKNTSFTLDQGRIRVNVYKLSDGTLFLEFGNP